MNANAIEKYFKNFYDEENCLFDFKKNDNTLTVSGIRGAESFAHVCHVCSHIGDSPEREHWGVSKISAAIAYQQGDIKARNGSYEPSWFVDAESLSDYVEYFLTKDSKELKEFVRWINYRDINWNNPRTQRFSVTLTFKEVTGVAMAAHTDYSKRFDCHAVHLVFEYTASHKDGEFALYSAYPVLTFEDRAIVKANYM